VTINLRDKFANMPVLALFPGPGKPPSTTVILECLREDFAPLATTGFNVRLANGDKIRVKARLAFVMGDSPGSGRGRLEAMSLESTCALLCSVIRASLSPQRGGSAWLHALRRGGMACAYSRDSYV
jgi:hypothetical protein